MTEVFNSEAIERYTSDNNTDEESVVSSTEIVPNLKLEIMMRKEKERKDDEANYTFRPKVKGEVKKNNSYQDSESDRFSRLYSDAVKRKIEQKQKQNIEPELTFKPFITPKASSRASSRERSGQWVGERLYTTAATKTANNLGKSKQKEDNNFTPVISRRAKSIERSNEKDTCDRLYKQSKLLREKLEKVQREKSTKALDGCTFTPRTTKKSTGGSNSKSSSEPRFDPAFPDRMKQYDESRIKRVEEKMQSKIDDELKNATFRPHLVTKSKHSAGTDPNVSVHLRLSSTTSKDLSTIEAEYYAESTFKPRRVTKSTKRSTSASPLRAPHQEEYVSVHERLYKVGEQKLKEIEQDRQQLREELKKQTPFKPTINPSRHRDYEDEPVPVFDRLNAADNRCLMDEVLAKIKTEIELRGCTFHPTLFARRKPSYQLDEPVHTRLSMDTEAAKAQQAKKVSQKVAEELSTSFAPHLPEQSVEIARRRSLVLNVITGADQTDVYSRLASQ